MNSVCNCGAEFIECGCNICFRCIYEESNCVGFHYCKNCCQSHTGDFDCCRCGYHYSDYDNHCVVHHVNNEETDYDYVTERKFKRSRFLTHNGNRYFNVFYCTGCDWFFNITIKGREISNKYKSCETCGSYVYNDGSYAVFSNVRRNYTNKDEINLNKNMNLFKCHLGWNIIAVDALLGNAAFKHLRFLILSFIEDSYLHLIM